MSLVARFPALRKLGRRGRRREIPEVRQLTAVECGAACLAMVLGYHGKHVPLAEVRETVGVDRDGADALAILKAARWYGLRARGVRAEADEATLRCLPTATVLHWNLSHFVVFERLERGAVRIVDPGFGRRRVSLAEFGKAFTGVALVFEPGEDFEEAAPPGRRLARHAAQALGESGRWGRILVTSLLLQLFGLAMPVLTSSLVDRVLPRRDYDLLVTLLAGFAALVGFQFLASMIRAHLLLHARTHLDARMTLGFFEHLVELPYAFFQRRSAGDLILRMESQSTVREIVTGAGVSVLIDGTLVVLYLLVLLAANARMGLLVLALGGAQLGALILTGRRQRELLGRRLEAQTRAYVQQVEMVQGIETLKATGSERRAVEAWSHLFVDLLNVHVARDTLGARLEALTATLRMGAPVAILGYGALQVLRGDLTLGGMLGLSALAGGCLVPLTNLAAIGTQVQTLGTYLDRINDVLDAAPEQEPGKMRLAPTLRGRIALDRVSFRYSPPAPLVVQDVSVEIAPGSFVALVGRSGSGKSSLAALLLGLYPPTGGRIVYDGEDLADLDLRAVRRQLGIVPQRPHLFSASIRANIALADPTVPLPRVVEAAQTACIHDEITAMPMGYDTLVSEGGASLSGGQRQRLALARALVAAPAVLLLDEATSALDTAIEARVQARLDALRCTRIVIAHRLSTVINADVILVMDGGRLVERGTHAELLARGGTYAALVAAQLRGDAEAPRSARSRESSPETLS